MLRKSLTVLKVLVAVPVVGVLAALSVASVAGFFGNLAQLCELASHFRFLYLLAFIPCLAILLCLRFWKISAFFALFFITNAAMFLQFYLPTPHPSGTTSHLSLLQVNAWGPKNSHHDEVLALIKEKSPDLVGVSEITETWVRVLSEGLPDYKYKVIEKRFGGIALFSRTPISNSRVVYYGPIKRPRIEATIELGQKPVTIIFAHPVIPKEKFNIRNGELSKIASAAGNAKTPVIVFGDLNCSPWSYYFVKLLEVGRLSDSERGFGFQPTWTTKWPFPCFPIDHCLVSNRFYAVERVVGPSVGSDHLPVYVKLGMADTSSN